MKSDWIVVVGMEREGEHWNSCLLSISPSLVCGHVFGLNQFNLLMLAGNRNNFTVPILSNVLKIQNKNIETKYKCEIIFQTKGKERKEIVFQTKEKERKKQL